MVCFNEDVVTNIEVWGWKSMLVCCNLVMFLGCTDLGFKGHMHVIKISCIVLGLY